MMSRMVRLVLQHMIGGEINGQGAARLGSAGRGSAGLVEARQGKARLLNEQRA